MVMEMALFTAMVSVMAEAQAVEMASLMAAVMDMPTPMAQPKEMAEAPAAITDSLMAMAAMDLADSRVRKE